MTERDRLYTARWCLKAIAERTTSPDIEHLAKTGFAHLTAVIGDGEGAPVAWPKSKVEEMIVHSIPKDPNWIPFATKHSKRMRTRGKYKKGWPLGAVVHYTAGTGTPERVIDGGIRDGYAYLCIGRDGEVVQAHAVSDWGYHAGESKWKGLLGSVSDDLIGIEIISAGRLTEHKGECYPYWCFDKKKNLKPGSKPTPLANRRYSAGKENQAKGWYEVYTPEQEKTLIEILLYLKACKPSVFDFDLVRGHDEVSGPLGLGYFRKTDPGASLSMTMSELRRLIKEKWEKASAA